MDAYGFFITKWLVFIIKLVYIYIFMKKILYLSKFKKYLFVNVDFPDNNLPTCFQCVIKMYLNMYKSYNHNLQVRKEKK